MTKDRYQQYLPDYIEKFKHDDRWIKTESQHYEFYYFKKSTAEREIVSIKQRQERAFKKIVKFLKVKPQKQKIKYYFYPNSKIKKKLMGNDWYAQSILSDFTVHVIYTNKIKPIGEHEDTHLLSLSWGLSIGFFQEGLAEYMVGYNWEGQDHDLLAKEALNKNILLPLRSMLNHKNWVKLSDKNILYQYCFAGSLVKFLIQNFGFEKFKKLYKKTDRNNSLIENERVFFNIYKKSPHYIEKAWRLSL